MEQCVPDSDAETVRKVMPQVRKVRRPLDRLANLESARVLVDDHPDLSDQFEHNPFGATSVTGRIATYYR